MATSIPAANRASSLVWFWEFLRGELAPYPSRSAVVARIVLTTTFVMVVVMTFQIPYGAFAALYALLNSRETPDTALKDLKAILVGFAFSLAYLLIGAAIFSGEPVLRLLWVLTTLFLIFFALSSIAVYITAVRFGYLLVVSIPIFDARTNEEQKIVNLLWVAGVIAMASIIAAAVQLIFASFYGFEDVKGALIHRLKCTASALRARSLGDVDHRAEQQLAQLALLGTSRMRRDLLRAGYSSELMQQLGTLVALAGRMIDLAANLPHLSTQPLKDDQRRFGQLADQINSLIRGFNEREDSQTSQSPTEVNFADSASTMPLLIDLERAVANFSEVLRRTASTGAVPLPADTAEPTVRFLVPDAFVNVDHIKFAIRGSLAAAACYLAYNLIDWPGISTSMATCFITALTTVGSSRQKQVLRFSGAVVGGTIGVASQVFVLPYIDSITGFLLLFVVVTTVAAWIAVSGPRLSYFGIQLAFAFYLIHLQEFKFQTSLAVARDRVVGILIGLLAMWLVFDQLWEAPAILEMKQTFVSALQLVARLMREPVSFDQQIAIAQGHSLRETINYNFEKLRQEADAVTLEFGAFRERDMVQRNLLLKWLRHLRIIFIVRAALLKYRLRYPGFELPEDVLRAQQTFDLKIAARIDNIANSLLNKSVLGTDTEPLLPIIEKPIQGYRDAHSRDSTVIQLETLLPLCSYVDGLVAELASEIGGGWRDS
jgi:multidrug resistance protein MdtO